MGALNIPSAADIERLTRRLRAVSHRLEGIEDGVQRLDRALASHGRRGPPGGDRGAAGGARRQAGRRRRVPEAKRRPLATGHASQRQSQAKASGSKAAGRARPNRRPSPNAPAAKPKRLSQAERRRPPAHRLGGRQQRIVVDARARAVGSNVSDTASTQATGTPARAPTANRAAASISTASALVGRERRGSSRRTGRRSRSCRRAAPQRGRRMADAAIPTGPREREGSAPTRSPAPRAREVPSAQIDSRATTSAPSSETGRQRAAGADADRAPRAQGDQLGEDDRRRGAAHARAWIVSGSPSARAGRCSPTGRGGG